MIAWWIAAVIGVACFAVGYIFCLVDKTKGFTEETGPRLYLVERR